MSVRSSSSAHFMARASPSSGHVFLSLSVVLDKRQQGSREEEPCSLSRTAPKPSLEKSVSTMIEPPGGGRRRGTACAFFRSSSSV